MPIYYYIQLRTYLQQLIIYYINYSKINNWHNIIIHNTNQQFNNKKNLIIFYVYVFRKLNQLKSRVKLKL